MSFPTVNVIDHGYASGRVFETRIDGARFRRTGAVHLVCGAHTLLAGEIVQDQVVTIAAEAQAIVVRGTADGVVAHARASTALLPCAAGGNRIAGHGIETEGSRAGIEWPAIRIFRTATWDGRLGANPLGTTVDRAGIAAEAVLCGARANGSDAGVVVGIRFTAEIEVGAIAVGGATGVLQQRTGAGAALFSGGASGNRIAGMGVETLGRGAGINRPAVAGRSAAR
jgi:hypothetical protein